MTLQQFPAKIYRWWWWRRHLVYTILMRAWLRFRGATIDPTARFWGPIEVRGDVRGLVIGADVTLEAHVFIWLHGTLARPAQLTIGAHSYVGRYAAITVDERVTLGVRSTISAFTSLQDHDHGTAHGVSMRDLPLDTRPIIIEDDAWIGMHCVVLRGVTIGTSAIIGAGSVVTRSIPAHMIAFGVPAQVARPRASESP